LKKSTANYQFYACSDGYSLPIENIKASIMTENEGHIKIIAFSNVANAFKSLRVSENQAHRSHTTSTNS
jgi:hypothetical protein